MITANASADGHRLMDVSVQMQEFKATLGGQSLSVDDLAEEETSIVRFSQWERFHKEIVALTSGKLKVKKKKAQSQTEPSS